MKAVIRLITVNTILFVILFFAIIGMIWNDSAQLELFTSFKQHVIAVAPNISEQEEESLWSEWTQMKCRDDYESIYEKLINIAKKNNIELPKNKKYSLSGMTKYYLRDE